MLLITDNIVKRISYLDNNMLNKRKLDWLCDDCKYVKNGHRDSSYSCIVVRAARCWCRVQLEAIPFDDRQHKQQNNSDTEQRAQQ